MARQKGQSYEDITERAANSLDMVLRKEERDQAPAEPQVTVEEALNDVPVLEYDSGRSKTRVLFLTSDASFIDPTTDALEAFYDFARQFDEMHIIVLRAGIKPRYPSLRIKENIWFYIAHSDWWWWTPVIASEEVAKNELVFAAGFRPDVVVGLEPYEAGLAAQWLGKAYGRPVQIHVREDFFTKSWRAKRPNNFWRRLIAWFVLRRAPHVAVATDSIRNKLEQKLGLADDLPKLPRFHHFQELREMPVEHDLHQRYPQYETIILFVGPLNYETSLFSTIDALKYKLANPRVAFVILGDGPSKRALQEKVTKLGLDTQVIFESNQSLKVSYMKSADIMVVTDTEGDSNELTLQGVVAKTPMLMCETELRNDLFKDGESAFLCSPGDKRCLLKKLNSFMHEKKALTEQWREAMAVIEREHLHEDSLRYRRAYRDLIETVFEDYGEETGDSDGEDTDTDNGTNNTEKA